MNTKLKAMPENRQRGLTRFAVAGLILFLLVALAVLHGPTLATRTPPSREVLLVAKGVRFNDVNPPIPLRVGETVQLVVRNDEPPGVAHDLVITGPKGKASAIVKPGESQSIVFSADREGIYSYSCSLHPGLMHGQIIVRRR